MKYTVLFIISFLIFSCTPNDGFPLNQLGTSGRILNKKIDHYRKTITLTVGADVDLKNMTPVIETPQGTSVDPASGQPMDFTDTVEYTVWMDEDLKYTDFDGSRKYKKWKVTVRKEGFSK